MYDHVGIRTQNLDVSARFYADVMATLGHVEGYRDASTVGFGPAGAPALWLHHVERKPASGVHIAFRAATTGQVDAFHRAALAAGGRDNGAPGLRPSYGPTYYAAFVIDPDGNNVEAMLS